MNLVEKAAKVMNFKASIARACAKEKLNVPSNEEISEYINKCGMDLDKFMADYKAGTGVFSVSVDNYTGIEKKTLIATLKLGDRALVSLWNTFIEESALYGEDSYIYDLTSTEDTHFLNTHMSCKDVVMLNNIIQSDKPRFIQWFSMSDRNVTPKFNIKRIIAGYWSEIFNRIMLFPSAYGKMESDDINLNLFYFDDVFFPVIANEVGYIIDPSKGRISKK